MRTITVTGRGAVLVVPDTAGVSFTVHHSAGSVAEALAGCDSAARLAGQVARDHTDASRIASRHLHVGPDHDREGVLSGYRAEHSMRVGCPDLDAAGALVGALAERVGDRLQVEGIRLEVSDAAEAGAAAREAAFVDARARATHLAELAGLELGDVQTISEGSRGDDAFAEAAADARPLSAELTFEPGMTSVGASLTVTYQLVAAVG